jgi:hypothetical protein
MGKERPSASPTLRALDTIEPVVQKAKDIKQPLHIKKNTSQKMHCIFLSKKILGKNFSRSNLLQLKKCLP